MILLAKSSHPEIVFANTRRIRVFHFSWRWTEVSAGLRRGAGLDPVCGWQRHWGTYRVCLPVAGDKLEVPWRGWRPFDSLAPPVMWAPPANIMSRGDDGWRERLGIDFPIDLSDSDIEEEKDSGASKTDGRSSTQSFKWVVWLLGECTPSHLTSASILKMTPYTITSCYVNGEMST